MTHATQPITLFGATGYTGQLVAQALARAGLPFRIAGRSASKLARLSAALPGQPEWLTADAAKSSSLAALFQDTRLLINCAGPFTDLGERVISQAALGGVHYLDITNELGYVFRARGYNDLAQKTGAALVPACGFEVALADCAAHVVAAALTGPNQRTANRCDQHRLPAKLDRRQRRYAPFGRPLAGNLLGHLPGRRLGWTDPGWEGQALQSSRRQTFRAFLPFLRKHHPPGPPGGASSQRLDDHFPRCAGLGAVVHSAPRSLIAQRPARPNPRHCFAGGQTFLRELSLRQHQRRRPAPKIQLQHSDRGSLWKRHPLCPALRQRSVRPHRRDHGLRCSRADPARIRPKRVPGSRAGIGSSRPA